MPSFSPNTKYVITGPQRIAPWVFAGGLQLDKDEVGPGLAGALCLKADSLPPPVAGRRDHVLEVGLLVHDSVAGAPSSQLLPHRLALARHAHLVSSVELHSLLLEHAGLHRFVHAEHHAVLVVVVLLDEGLEVRAHVPAGGPLRTVLARQQHGGLSESRDFVPVLLRASALHPAAAGLLQVFTFLTSVGRWMENSP